MTNNKNRLGIMRYEIYDINNEVISAMDDVYEALSCAECYDAKFVYDTKESEVIFGSVE